MCNRKNEEKNTHILISFGEYGEKPHRDYYDSAMSHRWEFKPVDSLFKRCVCFLCLQGRGCKGHSCLKPPLGQRITWGLPGLYTHTHTDIYTHTELMDEAWCTVEPWGQNSLALNYISQHDRTEVEWNYCFTLDLAWVLRCPVALHCISVLFPSHKHTHTHATTNTQLKKHFESHKKSDHFTFLLIM